MSTIWPKPNEHGVFSQKQCEALEYQDSKVDVVILVVQIGDDVWVSGGHIHYQGSYIGSLPSLPKEGTWRKGFSSRQDAINDEIRIVHWFFDQKFRVMPDKLRKWLDRQQLQMVMF